MRKSRFNKGDKVILTNDSKGISEGCVCIVTNPYKNSKKEIKVQPPIGKERWIKTKYLKSV